MEKILLKVLHMSSQASIVIGAIILARICMRRLPKKYTFMLWFVVGFRLLCPVEWKSKFSVFNLRPLKKVADTTNVEKIYHHHTTVNVTKGISASHGAVVPKAKAVTDVVTKPEMGVSYMQILIAVWLIGIIAIMGYTVIKYIRLKKKMKQATWLYDNVYESNLNSSPFVIGFIKPRIYLPPNITEKEREYLVMHEKVHVQYGDYFGKLLGLFAVAIHWFNPFVWVSFILYGNDIEMRCDEVVLDKLGYRIKKDYSMSLVNFATEKENPTYVVASLNFSKKRFGGLEIKMRIKNILGYKRASKIVAIAAVVLVGGVSVFCASNAKEVDVTTQEVVEDTASKESTEEVIATVEKENGEVATEEVLITTVTKVKPNENSDSTTEDLTDSNNEMCQKINADSEPIYYLCESCRKALDKDKKAFEEEGLIIDDGGFSVSYGDDCDAFRGIAGVDCTDEKNTIRKYEVYADAEKWEAYKSTLKGQDLKKVDYGYYISYINEVGQIVEVEYHEQDQVIVEITHFTRNEKE